MNCALHMYIVHVHVCPLKRCRYFGFYPLPQNVIIKIAIQVKLLSNFPMGDNRLNYVFEISTEFVWMKIQCYLFNVCNEFWCNTNFYLVFNYKLPTLYRRRCVSEPRMASGPNSKGCPKRDNTPTRKKNALSLVVFQTQ